VTFRLVSERVVVRKFQHGDAAAFASYRSDPAVARYQSWQTPLAAEAAATEVAAYSAGDPDTTGWFQYAIALDDVLIGDIGVNVSGNRMQAEIGFSLATPFQGRGYAIEAVRRMIRHLFTERGLYRISAECDARNTASALLLERVGFQREGLRREHTWIKGEWTDDLLFGLLARDYSAAAATEE
jgi:aminoglycoside 6'-N-acetyltransferase